MTTEWPPAKEFWEDEFPKLTKERTSPALFKGLIPESIVSYSDAIEAVTNLKVARDSNVSSAANVRIYVGEERRDDLVDVVMDSPGWGATESFVPWMQRLVASERFSFIINNLEVASGKLASGLGTLLKSVFEGWGLPMGGAEQAAFLGNYAGTAFGVHEGYEDAFLCHFGPGTKNFYCWDNDLYVNLAQTSEPTFGDYDWLLEHGQLFPLEPGDVLFLPRRVYHVGVQSEFSVSIALPLYTYPLERFTRLAIVEALANSLVPANDILAEPSSMFDAEFGAAHMASILLEETRSFLAAMEANAESVVDDLVQNRWAALGSNGGWEVIGDDLAKTLAKQEHAATPIKVGDVVTLRHPYQIVRLSADVLYLRGEPIRQLVAPEITGALNEYRDVVVTEDTLHLFQDFSSTGGLMRATRKNGTNS